jgi:hypothetical protein
MEDADEGASGRLIISLHRWVYNEVISNRGAETDGP